MTRDELKILKAGDTVGYRLRIGDPIVDAIVIENGPRLNAEGIADPLMSDILVVQIGAGPDRVTWQRDNFPDGIPQLVPPEAEPA